MIKRYTLGIIIVLCVIGIIPISNSLEDQSGIGGALIWLVGMLAVYLLHGILYLSIALLCADVLLFKQKKYKLWLTIGGTIVIWSVLFLSLGIIITGYSLKATKSIEATCNPVDGGFHIYVKTFDFAGRSYPAEGTFFLNVDSDDKQIYIAEPRTFADEENRAYFSTNEYDKDKGYFIPLYWKKNSNNILTMSRGNLIWAALDNYRGGDVDVRLAWQEGRSIDLNYENMFDNCDLRPPDINLNNLRTI